MRKLSALIIVLLLVGLALPAFASGNSNSNPQVLWLLPSQFDGSFTAAQLQSLTSPANVHKTIFPQKRVRKVECGRWGQLDTYNVSSHKQKETFDSLGDTLVYGEDFSIYKSHVWVYGGDCEQTTTTVVEETSTTVAEETTTTEVVDETTTTIEENTTTVEDSTSTTVGEETSTTVEEEETTTTLIGVVDKCSTRFEDECFSPTTTIVVPTVSSEPQLPFTGINTGALATVGAMFLLFGVIVVSAFKTREEQ